MDIPSGENFCQKVYYRWNTVFNTRRDITSGLEPRFKDHGDLYEKDVLLCFTAAFTTNEHEANAIIEFCDHTTFDDLQNDTAANKCKVALLQDSDEHGRSRQYGGGLTPWQLYLALMRPVSSQRSQFLFTTTYESPRDGGNARKISVGDQRRVRQTPNVIRNHCSL